MPNQRMSRNSFFSPPGFTETVQPKVTKLMFNPPELIGFFSLHFESNVFKIFLTRKIIKMPKVDLKGCYFYMIALSPLLQLYHEHCFSFTNQ